MPKILLHIKDDKKDKSYFCEWSTVVDAPVTALLPLKEFKSLYISMYGVDGEMDFEERITRAIRYGSSLIEPRSAESIIEGNRAGKHEKELTKKQLIKAYTEEE